MKWVFRFVLIIISTIFLLPISYASENVFYVLRHTTPAVMSNLTNHSPLINIIISQAYQVDQHGKVWGSVNPELASFAKTHHLKLMIMITNANFDNEKVHHFLTNSAACQQAIAAIVKECQQNQYAGVQFDFEGIALKDKAAFTYFLQTAANALHRQGFLVSFAVAPLLDANPQTAFLKRSYEVWEGAYDVKALGKSGDFLTLMTYNQHTNGTTPGPTACYAWVEQAIKYALKLVPANKLSLGIATYSSYWYTGVTSHSSSHKISVHMTEIPYNTALKLLQNNHTSLRWDDLDKMNYAAYSHHWLKEYIFVEDAKSFQAKLNLVKKYHLRGISAFRLGIEDPNIWKTLG